ncbi:MAG: hypothetical protein DRH32_09400 [Deltaproteobacteria bacterium]|nr:MAG: hypothetical protein DRH32_09400 [Deltaproteobacteria bacterium]
MKAYPLIIAAILIIVTSGSAWAGRMAVDVPIANIRSGPGTKYDIIWKVEKYHPFMVIKKSGSWYRIKDFEQDEGWIHKSLVSDIRTVITRKNKCNVRSGPATSYDILFTVEKGVPFKVLERRNNWIHVQHADGDRGWIHKSLIW